MGGPVSRTSAWRDPYPEPSSEENRVSLENPAGGRRSTSRERHAEQDDREDHERSQGHSMTRGTAGMPAQGADYTFRLHEGDAELLCEVEAVSDVDEFGDLAGVEILGLRADAGVMFVPTASVDVLPRWSYDEEVDAFYLTVSDTPSYRQDVVRVELGITASTLVWITLHAPS